MTGANPYRPPIAPEDTRKPWWKRLKGWFNVEEINLGVRFRNGEAFIINGIAFYVDRKNPRLLYAASPSTRTDDVRMQLVADESIRSVPMLVEGFTSFRKLIGERVLVIRLVDSYRIDGQNIRRELETNLDCETILDCYSKTTSRSPALTCVPAGV